MSSMRDYLEGKGGRKRPGPRTRHKIPVLVGIIVLLLGLWGGMTWLGTTALVPTDPDTLCPLKTSPSEILVLLLDMSDQLSEPQRLQIRNEFEGVRSAVRRFGLIEVYAVDRTGQLVVKPLLHLCNPGTEADVNRLYQNPRMARERWKTFSTRLDEELTRLMTTNGSATSPIFEAIQSTALRTFNLSRYDNVPQRLILVSDLLQNVPGKLNQYQSSASFNEFSGSNYFTAIRADLSGVDVDLFYLMRSTKLQDSQHLLFWEQYFVAQGAKVQSVVPIFGAD